MGDKQTMFLSVEDIKVSAPATKVINNVSVSTSDVQIDPSRLLWFRLFTPTTNSNKSLPLIIYFHGGGFRRLGPDTKAFDHLCSHFSAKVPAVVASVNYRYVPHHKYPTQYEDSYDALKFMDNAQNTAIFPAYTDFNNCFIGGDSSGGNIAHHVTVRALKNHFNRIRIAGLVALQPAFGGEERTESELRCHNIARVDGIWRDFLPEGADRNHPAVNVSGGGPNSEAAKELKKLLEFPPTLVIMGGKCPVQDWDKRYVEWLKNCGKEVEPTLYPDVAHAFYAYPEAPEFELLVQRLKFFIHKRCNIKFASANNYKKIVFSPHL